MEQSLKQIVDEINDSIRRINEKYNQIETQGREDLSDWVGDIHDMHTKFGVREKVKQFDKEKLTKMLEFKVRFLQEELDELKNATNADDVVDALIDLCVVSLDTLGAYGVNADLAWNRVHEKNMQKEVGIKASRPNPLGLPDLIKPEGWTPPTHADNVGLLAKIFE